MGAGWRPGFWQGSRPDCQWGKPVEVSVDRPYPSANLQEAEKMWLVACLAAMGNKRFDDVLSRYSSKQSGSEK